MTDKAYLQYVDALRHPTCVVVSTGSLKVELPPLLPLKRSAKEEVSELEELLVSLIGSGDQILIPSGTQNH